MPKARGISLVYDVHIVNWPSQWISLSVSAAGILAATVLSIMLFRIQRRQTLIQETQVHIQLFQMFAAGYQQVFAQFQEMRVAYLALNLLDSRVKMVQQANYDQLIGLESNEASFSVFGTELIQATIARHLPIHTIEIDRLLTMYQIVSKSVILKGPDAAPSRDANVEAATREFVCGWKRVGSDIAKELKRLEDEVHLLERQVADERGQLQQQVSAKKGGRQRRLPHRVISHLAAAGEYDARLS